MVSKTLHLDLNNVIESFRPGIAIMQLGSNDLTDSDPLHVGSAIDNFVRLLHDTYGVKDVCVCQTIMRQGAVCLLYTSPSPRDRTRSRMPSSA